MFDINTAYETKFAHGALWLKIYHRQLSKGLFNKNNVYHCDKPGLYSMLDQATDILRIDGKYEFLYEIPKYDVKTTYNRWRQTNYPSQQTELISGKFVDGFQPIHISWDRVNPEITSEVIYFTGLAKSLDENYALFDGTSKSTFWYFSVGIMNFPYNDPNILPGYGRDSEIILWVRIMNNWCTSEIRLNNVITLSVCIVITSK